MLLTSNRLSSQTQDTVSPNKRQTLWLRSRRQREHRVKRRRNIIHRQPTNTVASFEQSLFADLSALFRRLFIDFPNYEREDAEQDCLCQSWLAYKKLPNPIAEKITAEQLAVKIYQTYCGGGRFLALV